MVLLGLALSFLDVLQCKACTFRNVKRGHNHNPKPDPRGPRSDPFRLYEYKNYVS